MNLRYPFLICLLIMMSCSTTKYREDDIEDVQGYNGVKYAKLRTIKNFKAVPDTTLIEFTFNKKALPIEQIDYYGKNYNLTKSKYNKKGYLLEEITFTMDSVNEGKSIYEYDKKNNLTQYSQVSKDGTISFIKQLSYDKKNNIIKSVYLKLKKEPDTYDHIHNYKERSVIIRNSDITKTKNRILKMFYNNKGFVTKTEYLDINNNFIISSTVSYDKHSNIEKHTIYSKGEIARINTFVTIYDSKGNLIERRKFENKKLSETLLFELTY